MTEKTFVYNDTEVKLTGRTAEREIKSSARPSTRKAIIALPIALVEITPVDPETGSWKKWVKFIDLYEIKTK